MRLSAEQTQTILHTVSRWAGDETSVYLFGSRLNDAAKGGDIDLFIETNQPLSTLQRAHIKLALENQLGLPVDIVVKARHGAATPFQNIAKKHAIKLI